MNKFKFERQLLVATSQTDLHNFMEIRKLISQMNVLTYALICIACLLRIQFMNFDKRAY